MSDTSKRPPWRARDSRLVWLVLGIACWELGNHGLRAVHDLALFDKTRPHLAAAINAPLLPQEVDPSWILEGQPRFSSRVYAQTPSGKTLGGVWKVDGPTRFEWRFGLDETVYILEGAVNIEYQGRTFKLGPGDTAYFPAGTRATWHVPERLVKSFTLDEPGRVTRWLRVLFSS
jgi:uncharacterized protein